MRPDRLTPETKAHPARHTPIDGTGDSRDSLGLLNAYLDWDEAVNTNRLLVLVKRGHVEKFRNDLAALQRRVDMLEREVCTCPWPADAARTRHLLSCRLMQMEHAEGCASLAAEKKPLPPCPTCLKLGKAGPMPDDRLTMEDLNIIILRNELATGREENAALELRLETEREAHIKDNERLHGHLGLLERSIRWALENAAGWDLQARAMLDPYNRDDALAEPKEAP